MAAMTTGEIVRLISDKGFGFIKASSGEEYFFHLSAVANGSFLSLREGHMVNFEPTKGPKGPRAENVSLV